MEYIGFIYKTTCLVNGKIYIGKHETTFEDGYLGSGTKFSAALKKYGKENFKREILRYCTTLHELRIWEKVFIKKYHSQNSEIGYNIADGDVNSSDCNPAKLPEVIRKMTEINRKTTSNEEYRRKQSEIMKAYFANHEANFKGQHHSKETIEKIRQSRIGKPSHNKGKKMSDEQKKRQSEIMKGRYVGDKNPNFGHKWSKEQREHLSRVKKGIEVPNRVKI